MKKVLVFISVILLLCVGSASVQAAPVQSKPEYMIDIVSKYQLRGIYRLSNFGRTSIDSLPSYWEWQHGLFTNEQFYVQMVTIEWYHPKLGLTKTQVPRYLLSEVSLPLDQNPTIEFQFTDDFLDGLASTNYFKDMDHYLGYCIRYRCVRVVIRTP